MKNLITWGVSIAIVFSAVGLVIFSPNTAVLAVVSLMVITAIYWFVRAVHEELFEKDDEKEN
jgi:fatty acid desaturase